MQKKLLQKVTDIVVPFLQHSNRRLYCISTDGDAHRRRALVALTLSSALTDTSEIYSKLSPLKLLNLHCGPGEITCDFDWKHVLKRF